MQRKIKSFEEIHGIIDTLSADAVYFNNQLNQAPNNQHLRRAYIRSAFALIEGTSFYWRCMINDSLRFNPDLFSESEELQLNEKGKKKEDEEVDKYYGTEEMIKFSLKMLAKFADEKIDLGREGWEKLKSSLKVRDRITHPRSNSNLEISDEEIKNVREALKWYFDMQSPLLNKLHEQGTFIPD